MNPGPQLHRSLTFWAGLLLILFTCWTWHDSHRRLSTLYAGHVTAGISANGILVYWVTAGSGWGAYRIPVPRAEANLKSQGEYFPPPIFRHHKPRGKDTPTDWLDLKSALQAQANRSGPGSWTLFIPFWLVLLTLTVTWSALLLWRARRRRAKLLQTS